MQRSETARAPRPLVRVVVAVALGAALELPARAQETPPMGPTDPPASHRVDRFGDPLPTGAVARLGTGRLTTATRPHVVSFSADGRLLAVGCESAWLHVFEVPSGRRWWQRQLFPRGFRDDGGEARLRAAAFSPDGRFLVTSCVGYAERFVWEARTGRLAARIEAPGRIGFSEDGRWLFVDPPPGEAGEHDAERARGAEGGGAGGAAATWDLEAGRPADPPPGAAARWLPGDAPRAQVEQDSVALGEGDFREIEVRGVRVDIVSDRAHEPLRSIAVDGVACDSAEGAPVEACLVDGNRTVAVVAAQPGSGPGGRLEHEDRPRWLLRLYDAASGELCAEHSLPEVTSSAVILRPAGDQLVIQQRRTYGHWDPRPFVVVPLGGGPAWTLPQRPRRGRGEGDPVDASAAVSADGRRLVVVDPDHQAAEWDLHGGPEQEPLHYHLPYGLDDDYGGEVVLSPDGVHAAWMMHAAWTGSLVLWRLGGGDPLPADRHRGPIGAVALSPDAAVVATGGDDGWVRLWRRDTGDHVRGWEAHQADDRGLSCYRRVTGLAFSPDGARLLSAAGEERVRVWEVATGRRLLDVEAPSLYPKVVAWSPDGHIIAAGYEYTVRLWSAEDGREIADLRGVDEPSSLAFSPSGRRLAAAGTRGHAVTVLDVAGRRRVAAVGGHTSYGCAQGAAFLSEDELLALLPRGLVRAPVREGVAYVDGTVVAEPEGVDERERVAALAVDAARGVAVTGGERLSVWDLASGRERARLAGHEGLVTALALSADGRWLVSGGHDRTALVWDLASEALPEPPPEPRYLPVAPERLPPAVAPAAATTAAGAAGAKAAPGPAEPPLPPGARMRLVPRGEALAVRTVAASADGGRVAMVAERRVELAFPSDVEGEPTPPVAGGGSVRIADRHLGYRPVEVATWTDPVAAIALSPDGAVLACAVGSSIGAYAAPEWAPLWSADRLAGGAARLAFSPDGALLVEASPRGRARVREPATGEVLAELTVDALEDDVAAPAVAFSSDGRIALATAAAVTVLSIVGWQRTLAFGFDGEEAGWAEPIACLAFSPDGAWLAGGVEVEEVDPGDLEGEDPPTDRVYVWSADTGERLSALAPRLGPVRAVAFAPDGSGLLATCERGLARIAAVGDGDGDGDRDDGGELGSEQGRFTIAARIPADELVPGSGSAWGDGGVIATSERGALRRYDPASASAVELTNDAPAPLWALAVDPAGRRIATSAEDGRVRVWDLDTRARVAAWATGGYSLGVAFLERGCVVAAVNNDWNRGFEWCVWDADGEAAERRVPGMGGDRAAYATALAAMPGGRAAFAVTRASNGFSGVGLERLVRFTLDDEAVGGDAEIGRHRSAAACIAVSADGAVVATAICAMVRVWDAATGAQLASLPAPEGDPGATALAFAPDRARIAAAGSDGRIRIWDTADPAEPRVVRTLVSDACRGPGKWDQRRGLHALASSADGRLLAAAARPSSERDPGAIDVWEPATGRLLTRLAPPSQTRALAFSPAAPRELVSAHADGAVYVWDLGFVDEPR